MDGRKVKCACNIDDRIKRNFPNTNINVLAVEFRALLENTNINNRINIGGINVASKSIGNHVDMIDSQFYQRIACFLCCGKGFVDNQDI